LATIVKNISFSYLKFWSNRNSLTEIFFHEDLYLQIEILSKLNLDFAHQQIDKISNFAKERLNNKLGFTDVIMRNENPIKTQSLKIYELDFEE